ncbi:MAG: hypothetical protein V1816_25235 [Pseudomonadota bacterium]
MAEIKSTLDLVMERTKHLTQTKEEREASQAREREGKARGLVLALREGRLQFEEIGAALRDADPDQPAAMLRTLVGLLVDNLGLTPEPVIVETLLRLDDGGLLAGPVREAQSLALEYEQARAEADQASQQGILRELADLGVSGSALVAKTGENDESGPSWENLELDFSSRLARIKRELHRKLG